MKATKAKNAPTAADTTISVLKVVVAQSAEVMALLADTAAQVEALQRSVDALKGSQAPHPAGPSAQLVRAPTNLPAPSAAVLSEWYNNVANDTFKQPMYRTHGRYNYHGHDGAADVVSVDALMASQQPAAMSWATLKGTTSPPGGSRTVRDKWSQWALLRLRFRPASLRRRHHYCAPY